MITVDTETFLIKNRLLPFEANIYGVIGGVEYGVRKIMEICEQYKARATFFVDVYMHHQFGEEKVRTLCEVIHHRGHDVELHAHANWIPNSTDEFVSSYSLSEQIGIIEEGKHLISKWTGCVPTAFRAGAYGLNLDTIYALEANGFLIDSSYFPFHPNCEMSKQLNNKYQNKMFKIGSVVEIPVSTYWVLHTFFYKKNSKLDINACSSSELQDILSKFIDSEINFVILFLHSFSFIRWKKDYSGFFPDHRVIDKFNQTLELIATFKNGDFLTMKEIVPLIKYVEKEGPDFTPCISIFKVIPRLMQRLIS